MKETATIVSMEGKTITLTKTDAGACASCSSSAFCKAKDQLFTASNPQGFELNVGDRVDIYMPSGKTILSGFMLLILPLIFFLVFFILAKTLFGIADEGMRALIGIGGVAFGFLFSFAYSRLTRRTSMPEIVGIAEGENDCSSC